MKITESNLRSLISRLLIEAKPEDDAGGVGPGWGEASSMQPSAECYKDLFKHEGPVPYVYDDGRKMSEGSAYKTYGNIIKQPKMQHIIKKRWPVGKMPYPVSDFKESKGYPTIGAGHLIKDAAEFEKFKEYTLKSITTDSDGKPIDQKAFNNASSSITIEAYLLSDDDIMNLFKQDVDLHTQFKTRITQPITQEMFDALTSIAFNAGWEAKHPKKGYKMPIQYIIELINKKKYKSAQQKILTTATTSKGKNSDGLVARRKDEAEKFGKGGIKPA